MHRLDAQRRDRAQAGGGTGAPGTKHFRFAHPEPARSFYLLAARRRLLCWNDNLETVSGYGAEELTGLGPGKFFDDQDWPLVEAAFTRALTEGRAEVEAVLVAKDGRRTPYHYTGVRVMVQGAPCLIGMGLT